MPQWQICPEWIWWIVLCLNFKNITFIFLTRVMETQVLLCVCFSFLTLRVSFRLFDGIDDQRKFLLQELKKKKKSKWLINLSLARRCCQKKQKLCVSLADGVDTSQQEASPQRRRRSSAASWSKGGAEHQIITCLLWVCDNNKSQLQQPVSRQRAS